MEQLYSMCEDEREKKRRNRQVRSGGRSEGRASAMIWGARGGASKAAKKAHNESGRTGIRGLVQADMKGRGDGGGPREHECEEDNCTCRESRRSRESAGFREGGGIGVFMG